MAGMGKSTIARTIAREYHKHGRLGASFFFSRGGGDLGVSNKLFTTLATQLATISPTFRSGLCAAISQSSSISDIGLYDQWERLIIQPLSRIESGSFPLPLVFVIDALDECDREDDVGAIIQLFATCRSLQNVRIRIFITSRPETPIRHGIHQLPGASHEDFVLHHLSPSIVERDISLFLRDRLEMVRIKYNLAAGWPGEDSISFLAQKAGGLFIYAATACRFIDQGGQFAERRLSLLRNSNSSLPPEKKLDEIYTTVLTYSVHGEYDEEETENLRRLFRQIVGPIVIIYSPLSFISLAGLIGKEEVDLRRTLTDLHSVLDVPERKDNMIRILHPSFRDFLLDQKRSLDSHFYVNEKWIHKELHLNCLRVMSQHLRRDICDLRLPGAQAAKLSRNDVDRHIPLHVQYACRYWVHHFGQSDTDSCRYDGIEVFLRKHLLHWLEALGAMGCMSEGVLMVKMLDSMIVVSSPRC